MIELQFEKTPYNSIRVWMHFDEGNKMKIRDSKEFKLFQLLSIWNGFDKEYDDLYSWELSNTLTEYIKEIFSNIKKCTIDI